MEKKLSQLYKTMGTDHFPQKMEITLYSDAGKQTLVYEKVQWSIGGELKGLRYGENPGQEASLYRCINGNIQLGSVISIEPGKYLASDIELIQSGKHPGKINITDADNALNILRYFTDKPCTVIVKHNNPCGVALGSTLSESYTKALMADRIAAFGGAVALNQEVDTETAEKICESYSEVVVAPEFAPGVKEIFAEKKNLRVMKIGNMKNLSNFVNQQYLDFKSLIDGGLIVQWSYVPKTLSKNDFLPAVTEYRGKKYRVLREPTEEEKNEMLFGWLVESGITSNSVIYVKNGATVGIGTGEQDRVGVAEIARDKAYRKYADSICFRKYSVPYTSLEDKDKKAEIDAEALKAKGGLTGSIMVSDAFFPFRDGIDVGLREGVTGVVQPGGSIRDFESVEACNEYNASMVFTGQRSFKH